MARPVPIDERSFHAWLARTLAAGALAPLPLGDDAAALPLPTGSLAVLTIDALVEGTHFLPASPPRALGRAATAVSLSDVAAKGAVPHAVLLALLLPPGTPRAWAEGVTLGAEREARRHGAQVLGGDTKPAPFRAVVSAVVGSARPHGLVGRTGARPGQVLVTTGTVGRGGVAARGLARARHGNLHAARALLRIEPRLAEGRALARYATAMLDTSDGLADSARLLAAASRVRLEVDERSLPWVPELRREHDPRRRRAAAFFGGDYELLATVPRRFLAAAVREVRRAGGRLTPIGSVVRGRGAFLRGSDGLGPMPPAGWRPFAGPARRPGVRSGGNVPRSRRPHATFK